MKLPDTYAGGRRWLLARLILNGFAQAGALIAVGLLVQNVFDGFVNTGRNASGIGLVEAFGALVGTGVFLAWLRMHERVTAERLGQDYARVVRNRVFAHLTRMSRNTLQRRSKGGVMLRMVGDVNALRRWVSLGVTRLWVAGVTCSGTLLALATLSRRLAIVAGLAIALGAGITYVLGRPLRRAAREARNSRSRLASNLFERLCRVQVMQVFGGVGRETRRVKRLGDRLVDAMVRRSRVIGLMRGNTEATVACTSAAVLVFGVAEIGSGNVTSGTVVAAMTVVGLLVPGLKDFGRAGEYWHDAAVAREKLEDFLALPATVKDRRSSGELADGDGALELDGVSVADCVRDLHAVAAPGETVAIVGANGAGKSTLFAAILRLVQLREGQIRLDGQDLSAVSLASLRQAVSTAGPEFGLLRGTIRRNLTYRAPHTTDSQLQALLRVCELEDFVAGLPDGLHTRVSEGGINLSLGQRQRLALARALLGKPRLLLLDELDANVDPAFQAVLRRVVSEFAGTVLLVTHRLETVRLADAVWHLAEGRLCESGPPAALLDGARTSRTARLFQPVLVDGNGCQGHA